MIHRGRPTVLHPVRGCHTRTFIPEVGGSVSNMVFPLQFQLAISESYDGDLGSSKDFLVLDFIT